MNLKIDPSRDALLTDFGKATLDDRYLKEFEKSPQEGFARAALAFSDDLAHAQRMYDYNSKLWWGLASPVLSNAPVRTKFVEPTILPNGMKDFTKNFMAQCFDSVLGALPISCFTSYVPDSRIGLADHYVELMWLSSNGGGNAAAWSDIRETNSTTSTGSKTGGLVPFFHVTDAEIIATHQGNNRRGVYGGWVDASHPEIEEFIESRKSSGSNNRRSRNVYQGVNCSDEFMYAVIQDKPWDLISPKDGVIKKTIKARELWEKMMELPFETGTPFLHFSSTTYRALPETQKALGLSVNNLNICTEITLANNIERTAVCCLSSLNILKYDEWKDHPTFIEDCCRFLDNVLEYFIQNAIYSCTKDYDWDGLKANLYQTMFDQTGIKLDPEQLQAVAHSLVEKNIMGMRKAVYSAKRERAIGLGSMGWGSYFMSKGLAYESHEALAISHDVSKEIHTQARLASLKLGKERGESPDMEGTGHRNSHSIAIAPTATNSTICGGLTAAGEPMYQNIYPHITKSGTFQVINPWLIPILDKYGINTPEIIKSIEDNDGSVQHIPELSDHERKVHRTAFEMDQIWIVEHAAVKQPHVCQAQSLNLFFLPNAKREYVGAVHFHIWKRGIKSRYYVRSKAIKTSNAFAKKVKIEMEYLSAAEIYSGCVACEA